MSTSTVMRSSSSASSWGSGPSGSAHALEPETAGPPPSLAGLRALLELLLTLLQRGGALLRLLLELLLLVLERDARLRR